MNKNEEHSRRLYVHKRGIWRERKNFYLTVAVFFAWICWMLAFFLYVGGVKNADSFTIIITILITACFIVCLSINIWTCKKNNHLLANGKVIFAKIDWTVTKCSMNQVFVKCSYFQEDINKLWVFEMSYYKENVELFIPDNFYEETFIPVIVNSQNLGEYIVLLEELLLSYRQGIDRKSVV